MKTHQAGQERREPERKREEETGEEAQEEKEEEESIRLSHVLPSTGQINSNFRTIQLKLQATFPPIVHVNRSNSGQLKWAAEMDRSN